MVLGTIRVLTDLGISWVSFGLRRRRQPVIVIVLLAALALLGTGAIVIGVPVMIVIALIRSRGPRPGQPAVTDPDDEFAALVGREWPGEAALLHGSVPPGSQ